MASTEDYLSLIRERRSAQQPIKVDFSALPDGVDHAAVAGELASGLPADYGKVISERHGARQPVKLDFSQVPYTPPPPPGPSLMDRAREAVKAIPTAARAAAAPIARTARALGNFGAEGLTEPNQPIPGLAPVAEAMDAAPGAIGERVAQALARRGIPGAAAAGTLAGIPAMAADLTLRPPATTGEAGQSALIMAAGAGADAAGSRIPILGDAPIADVPNAIRRRLGLPVAGQIVPEAPAAAMDVTPRPAAPPEPAPAPQTALPVPQAIPRLPARPEVPLIGQEAPIQGDGFVLQPDQMRRVFDPRRGELDVPSEPGAPLGAIARRLGLIPPEDVRLTPRPEIQPGAPAAAPKLTKKMAAELAGDLKLGEDPAKVDQAVALAKADKFTAPQLEKVVNRIGTAYDRSVRLYGAEDPRAVKAQQALQSLGIRRTPAPTAAAAPAAAPAPTPTLPPEPIQQAPAESAYEIDRPAIEKASGKKLFQMTRAEYSAAAPGKSPSLHEDAVMDALVRGKAVPDQVLNEHPQVLKQLDERYHNEALEAAGVNETPVLDMVRQRGISRQSAERFGRMGELENAKDARLLRQAGGETIDHLAESAASLGIIPENDPNLFMDALDHELRTGTRAHAPTAFDTVAGAGREGYVRLGGSGEQPADPQVVRDYRSRIREYKKNPIDVGGTLRKLQTELLDKDAALERLRTAYQGELPQDKDLRLLLARSRGAGGIAEANLQVGTFKLNPDGSVTKTGEALEPILRAMGRSWRDVETYMVAKRDLELAGRGIKGLDAEKAQEVATHLEAKYGTKISEAAQRYVDWEDRAFLQPMIDLGIITKDRAQAIRDSGKSYVVFKRWFDDLEQGGSIAGGNPLKRISGSERDIASPFQSVIRQNQAFTNFFERTRVGQAIYAMKDNAGLKGLVQEVPKAGPGTISVPIAGETKFLKVSPEVKAAYDNFSPGLAKATLGFLSIPAKLQRAGVTLDPRFSLFSHPFRYQVEASLLAKHGFVPGFDYLRGLAQVIGRGEYFDEWMAAGGDQTSLSAIDMAETPKKINELIGERPASNYSPLWLLQKIREVDDQGVRLGIFMRSRKAGASATEAAAAARDGVVDPAVHGTATGPVSKISAFFNIHLQSEARLIRELRDNPAQFMARLAPYMVATAALWWLNKDDKEYQEKPDWQKMLFWHVPVPSPSGLAGGRLEASKDDVGRRRYLPIPKPFLPGVIFMGGTEAMLNHIYQKDPQIIKHWAEQTLGEVLPLPIPTFARVPGELLAGEQGYSFFQHRPIVPNSRKDLQPPDRFGDYTSELGKAIGRRLNVAPSKVDYAIQGFGGTLARRGLEASNQYLAPKGTPPRPDQPLSPFSRPSIGENSESLNRFFDYFTQMQQADASFRQHHPDMDPPPSPLLNQFKDAHEFIKEYQDDNAQLLKSKSMDPAHKKVLMDRNSNAITNIARTAVKMFERHQARSPK
jgi:hypothetical protein